MCWRSWFAVFLLTVLPRGVPACEPAIEQLARDALKQSEASMFECPETLRPTGPDEKALCAIVDDDVEMFLERWDAFMAEQEVESVSSGSERTHRFARTNLMLRVRGGAVVVICGKREESQPPRPGESSEPAPETPADDASPTAETASDQDESPPPEESADATVDLHRLSEQLLAVTGASVFGCPDSMQRDGKGFVCAFFEGEFAEFEQGWDVPSSLATPLSDWVASGRARERDYEVGGRAIKVRFNNGAVAIAYDKPVTDADESDQDAD